MNHLVLLLMLVPSILFSQILPQFELTPSGVQPIVIQVDSMTAAAIYEKSINWVKESYKNPSEVLKADIKNEKIRINGFKEKACWYKNLGYKQEYDAAYSFEIDIKDGKARLTYTPEKFWANGHTVPVSYQSFFKDDGSVRKVYTDAKITFEQSMNELVASLYNYLTGKKKSDW